MGGRAVKGGGGQEVQGREETGGLHGCGRMVRARAQAGRSSRMEGAVGAVEGGARGLGVCWSPWFVVVMVRGDGGECGGALWSARGDTIAWTGLKWARP